MPPRLARAGRSRRASTTLAYVRDGLTLRGGGIWIVGSGGERHPALVIFERILPQAVAPGRIERPARFAPQFGGRFQI